MINWIVINSETIGLVISFIALLCSFYSIYLTKVNNKFDINISYISVDKDSDLNYPLLSFEIYNPSIKPINIMAIDFESINGEKLNVLYDYEMQYETELDELIQDSLSQYSQSKTDKLNTPYFMFPNERLNLAYYFESVPNELKLTISTDKMVSFFSFKKSFILHPYE